MRSTPWPNDTLRTVKDARVPAAVHPDDDAFENLDALFIAFANLDVHAHVSPDFGRPLVSCDFSTNSIALIPDSFGALGDELAQNALLFFVQRRFAQQLRPTRQRAAQRLAFAPAANISVVARQQDVGHP